MSENCDKPSGSQNLNRPLEGMAVREIAGILQVQEGTLWKLARKPELMYHPTRKDPKPGGGVRLIDPPLKEYKPLLRKLTRVLANRIAPHPCAHGGIARRSSFTSAARHCGGRVIATRDVRNCYPSVGRQAVRRELIALGASDELAQFLSGIMTVHDRLPQGGPLSSLALNLFLMRSDEELRRKTRSRGGQYTRLADDFVASADSRQKAEVAGAEFDRVIQSQGLKVNSRKRKRRGLLLAHQRHEIHSLIINSRRGTRPKDQHIQLILALAQRYARRSHSATVNDLVPLAELRRRVAGHMYYQRQATFSPARHVARILKLSDSRILAMVKANGLYPHKNKWWLKSNSLDEAARLTFLFGLRRSLATLPQTTV